MTIVEPVRNKLAQRWLALPSVRIFAVLGMILPLAKSSPPTVKTSATVTFAGNPKVI